MFPEVSVPTGNILLSMKTIAEWLTQEITKAGITQADLARKSGVSTAQIARAVNGTRGLSENSITAIAEALKIPPEQAFRDVGFLPPVPERTEQTDRLLYLFNQLDPDKKQDLLGYAEFLTLKK